ncbi:major facilitator superfamily domain-containing protein 6-A-like [Argiope bruennichi]|uniref:major facilitator superfamily domain-containing protein 6-A-like n=1 Tax=Argiope bruennichi TaxID=94029 RepID=UPI002494175A|nr:major facilitator superfamily domain-containing protein 6-A-like [Argiope bruennichi]
MENQTFTISFCGIYRISINKYLVPIKISLFCWFAGARTTGAFVPVYLKHQGLTLAHLSAMVTISVAFQFIAGMISGMFADRIGRVKPFLFLHASIFLGSLICFIVMPKIDECPSKTITFHCLDNQIIAQEPCQYLQDNVHTNSCSLIYKENATHFNEDCPLFLKEYISIERNHLNQTSGLCTYQIHYRNYSFKAISPCDIHNCQTFQVICSGNNSLQCHNNRMFWLIIYGILVVLYNTSRTNVYRFFDVITMDLINQYNSDFGKQRLWSVLGFSVGPPLAGLILHQFASNGNDKSYAPIFVFAAIFVVLSLIPVWKADPKFHKPAAKLWKTSVELVKDLEISLFLVFILILGFSFGFQMIYGNWYLQNLGASDLLLGVNTGVAAVSGIPFLYTAKWFINKTGVRNLFVFCLFSYAFYAFAFSLILEPWLAIGIELANAYAYHLSWVAVLQYCDEVAPVELQATMIVLAGTLHYNVARLGSTVIGGNIMNNFGGRMAYRALGGIALCYAVIYGTYLTFQRLHKRKNGVQLKWDERETEL